MKNVKNNNANLYSNFSPRFLKSYFLTRGGGGGGGAWPPLAMAPPGPPLESPMAHIAMISGSLIYTLRVPIQAHLAFAATKYGFKYKATIW